MDNSIKEIKDLISITRNSYVKSGLEMALAIVERNQNNESGQSNSTQEGKEETI